MDFRAVEKLAEELKSLPASPERDALIYRFDAFIRPERSLRREIKVLDHGSVRLDDHMANDLAVVNAARVSFATRKDELDASDIGLLNFLQRDHHGSPFEHNSFRFHIRCPIFVAREWMRHRIGSFNEFSLRYAKASDQFFMPEADDVRSQVGKPGAYTFEPVEDALAEATRARLQEVYDIAYVTYTELVEQGIAREVARVILPVGAYTEFYWTVNARALMNFLFLRNSSFAQREIRIFAEQVEVIFAEAMPETYRLWVEHGRIVP